MRTYAITVRWRGFTSVVHRRAISELAAVTAAHIPLDAEIVKVISYPVYR